MRWTQTTFVIGVALMLAASPARATWAIVLADEETGEVGIGQATCVSGIDLRSVSAVIVTGKGVATVQAYIDSSGVSRTTIRDQLLLGTAPADILTILDGVDPNFETHQYCIVDRSHDAATYTGTSAQDFVYAGGATGKIGTTRYCVAGNVLTGQPVIDEAVLAIQNTSGSLSDKLMAAMEAARTMGGDGRCSCSVVDPTSCGSPPMTISITAVNGYVVSARTGDTTACAQCGPGNYYLDLGVINNTTFPDPVLTLQADYNDFVLDQIGRPDAVRSTAVLNPVSLQPDGASAAELDVQLFDLGGNPIGGPILSFDVEQDPASDGVTTIGAPLDVGGGSYETTLTAGSMPGIDRFRVVADDGQRPVILIPAPRLPVGVPEEVSNSRWADKTSFIWNPVADAARYSVYRGDLLDLNCNSFGACRDDLDADATDVLLTDAEVPLAGRTFFYLISARDAEGNESTLGVSNCGIRPNFSPCPQ